MPGPDEVDRDFYVRQLKDWKFSAPIELMIPSGLGVYAGLCGWALARAHARSGDRVALAAYLGGSGQFDQAIADFAETYADQNERDYAASRPPPKKAGRSDHRDLSRTQVPPGVTQPGGRDPAGTYGRIWRLHHGSSHRRYGRRASASLGRRYLIQFEEDTLRPRPLWIRLIIEFLGTFVLVTVAAGSG